MSDTESPSDDSSEVEEEVEEEEVDDDDDESIEEEEEEGGKRRIRTTRIRRRRILRRMNIQQSLTWMMMVWRRKNLAIATAYVYRHPIAMKVWKTRSIQIVWSDKTTYYVKKELMFGHILI